MTGDVEQSPAVTGAPQEEMPFAMVQGEPYTTPPRDLYIPPDALEVFLEAFEGPLDPLLYLIRRQNLDILDIPLAQITHQYMEYVEMMKALRLELAAEYLVMASMLAEIKSRMLLPRRQEVEDEEQDPRAELIRRLQEYERYKQAAEDIDAMPRMERDVFAVNPESGTHKVVRAMPETTLRELLVAFREVVARSQLYTHHQVRREALSVRERMSSVLGALAGDEYVEFHQLFTPEEGRAGVVVTFLALLELVRESLIEVVQAAPFAPLYLRTSGSRAGGEERVSEDDGR